MLKWAKTDAETLNSASMYLEEIVEKIETDHKVGKRGVRLHTGDPSLYGAISVQMAALDKVSVPYKVIPGVTAAFAAAAAMGIEYTLPEVSQTLILTRIAGRTPVPETEALESMAKHQVSMAIYLSITLVSEVAEALIRAYGEDSVCAIAFCVSQPEERIIFTTLGELADVVKTEDINHQALIIAGKVLDVAQKGLKHKSKLYDKNFEHRFRKQRES